MLLTLRKLLFLSALAHVCCEDSPAAGAAVDSEDSEEDGVAHDASKPGHDRQENGKELISDDHLRAVHAELDVNGDKKASVNELLNFTEAHHRDVAMQEVSVEEVLAEKDTSKDGLVSLEEHLDDTVYSEKSDDEATRKKKIEDETALFKVADTNNDGLLDKNELTGIIFPETHEGATNVLMKQSMRDADADGNGKISLEEFKDSDLAESNQADNTAEETPETEQDDKQSEVLFQRLDKNGDGSLDQEELRPLKSGRIERENMVQEFVLSLDKDGDTHIDSTELVQGKSRVYDSDIQGYLLAWARRRQILGR